MVCNLVTYRARSAVREVGVALGFPRPLVDRVAKALETYDSVMVRRDLEADGGFAEFFRRPGSRGRRVAEARGMRDATVPGDVGQIRGLTDRMGQLNHAAVADSGPVARVSAAMAGSRAGSGPRLGPGVRVRPPAAVGLPRACPGGRPVCDAGASARPVFAR